MKSAIKDAFTEVRNTVNGRKDRTAKSYSKYLIIPLFKYPRPVLYMRRIRTNTLTLAVEVDGYEWVKERTGDRNYNDVLSIDLSLNSINDLTAIGEEVIDALPPDDGLLMMTPVSGRK